MNRFAELIGTSLEPFIFLMIMGVGSGFVLGITVYLIMWGIDSALSLIKNM
jgi:hypothetical protein